MKKYYLDKLCIAILNVVVVCIVICIISAVKYLMYYISLQFKAAETYSEIIIAGLVTIYVIWQLIILPMWYRSVCYELTSNELHISSGVIFKKNICLKLSAIQYTERVKLPVYGKLSFNFLLISICGKRLVMTLLSAKDLEEIDSAIRISLGDEKGK